ncbi:MAG: bifunctional proline dehydrogenase/L-glutamate gamma-semialdehyde dehydrogenase PutA [Alphaproteobacteria bacterium]|nr:bifunctional proline dehydrogenase/L-glutamate gamma-semialdehyde dehydrogenase PutA [Alphaproteobacteria bacterium]
MTLACARARLARAYLADEEEMTDALIAAARFSPDDARAVDAGARLLVSRVRAGRRQTGGLDAFLQEYALSSEEGVVLMCLAEALLRVPDAATADLLIKDKVGGANWERHLGRSDSLFVNASTWGLMLTGRVVKLDTPGRPGGILGRLVARSGEPVIRGALNYAMRLMGEQFVLGRSIDEALARARAAMGKGYLYSFDMLGEAAYTAEDAARYLASYHAALARVAQHSGPLGMNETVFTRPSLSVKLSALHPRYDYLQRDRVLAELVPAVRGLALSAREAGLGLTIDAEEAERLELSLDVFEALALDGQLKGWNGLGLAIQAYQKRVLALIGWLSQLARESGRRLPVRLVKGAYWDSEIKRAQELGLPGYPVYTRKAASDVSFLAAARLLLAEPDAFFPQFATHNAHTVAAVRVLARGRQDYEFQRLHGMGEPLHAEVMAQPGAARCRIYAPVGSHEDLLAYLVRRLLENGANSSFVNRLADDDAPIGDIVADPVETLAAMRPRANPRIALPRDIFSPRVNSQGALLSEPAVSRPLLAEMAAALASPIHATALVGGSEAGGEPRPVRDPANQDLIVGEIREAGPQDAMRAVALATAIQPGWDRLGGAARAAILRKAADLMEMRRAQLMALCVREAGKTVANALSDVREGIDFLRYYADEAEVLFAGPHRLPGPTGERNELSLGGRGIFAAIAPWNFPVAIFTGQVAAALAAGNAVLAKPAEQTPLAAHAVVRLLHEAGVPGDVLQFLPGDGPVLGRAFLGDDRVTGVVFTGSTAVARLIARRLAEREGLLATLIAETGGQNAMIVDSTALPEQVVRDVMASAFDSAGQRCSALRVLFLQEEIAPRVIALIKGALDELRVGDPMSLASDVGPVIDAEAKAMLEAHAAKLAGEGRLIHAARRLSDTERGFFVAPHVFEIPGIDFLTGEVFGPMLHIVRWQAGRLGQVVDAINATGFGLTLSVHSRIESVAAQVAARARVGNLYVNRNQIGAVVGAQPFGGQGLSGTGPKAGGPHYLPRFAIERVISTNTAAAGGNTALLALSGEG